MHDAPLLRRTAMALALGAMALGSGTGMGWADAIDGRWRVSDGTSIIVISPCGGTRCATVAWTNKGDRDALNADPALRNRPIVGLRVIWDLKEGAGNVWAGTGYNPNDGNTYATKVTVKSQSEIEISGCILGGLLCDSDIFTRVP